MARYITAALIGLALGGFGGCGSRGLPHVVVWCEKFGVLISPAKLASR